MRFAVIGGGALPEIEIMITHSKKKALKAIRRFSGDAGVEDYEALVNMQATTSALRDRKTGTRLYVVWMTPCTDYSASTDVALLAHEAVHVAQDYFREIGEDSPSDELYAYVVQDIVQHLVGEHFAWKKRHI